MAALKNNFEGIADQATLTQGSGGNTNTPGNDFFNAVGIGTSAVCRAAAGAAYEGTSGMEVFTRGGQAFSSVSWLAASLGTLTDFYAEVFFRLTEVPTNGNVSRIIVVKGNSDATLLGAVEIWQPAGGGTPKIRIHNASGTVVVTGAQTIPCAADATGWHRLEMFLHYDASAGYITTRYYADPSATAAATEELNAAGVTATWAMSQQPSSIHFGIEAATTNYPTATGSLHVDRPRAGQTTGWYGNSVASSDARIYFPVHRAVF